MTLTNDDHALTVTTPNDTDIVLRRVFDAPRRLVFDAKEGRPVVRDEVVLELGQSLVPGSRLPVSVMIGTPTFARR